MRITFVCPIADLSGGFRVIVTHAKNLRARGHDVLIMTRPPRKPTLRERLRSLCKRQPLPHHLQRGPSHLDNSGIPHIELDSARAPTADDLPDADVIIATWWETAEWISAMPASKGARVYFVQHHEIFPGQPVDRVEATYRLPIPKICVAQWLVDLCEQRSDAPATLVLNSVDLEQFCVPERGKQPVPTVGLMYSSIPFKGCDTSLKAFSLAQEKMPNLKLVAFGSSGPIPELPLPDGARFTLCPPQDQIKHIYASADAWLFGSRSEGFGLPILESMACRTPVIGTPAGAAPELLSGGGGVLTPLDDPQAMADAILQLCNMPEPAWGEMSNAAYRTASRYTWDDAADRLEAALMQTAGKSDKRSVAGVVSGLRP